MAAAEVHVIKDISHLVTCNDSLGEIRDAAIVYSGPKVLWVGPTADLPAEYSSCRSTSLAGCIVTPGVDSTQSHMGTELPVSHG
jgi:imidazolonepropionase-like amidohydrolase